MGLFEFLMIVLAGSAFSSEMSKKHPEIVQPSERQVCAESKYACASESAGE